MSLTADSICKRFAGRKVLSAATIEVCEGAVTALMGRNGAGKSTLLSVLAGLVRPDHGTIRLDGAYVPRPSLHRLARRGVFIIPDKRLPLSPAHTLRAHLAAVEARFGRAGQAGPLELAELLDRRTAGYSGGERKRAALALAFARSPRFLLLDEPFRDLSPLDAARIGDAIRRMAAGGAGVLVTGHEVPLVLSVADDVAWLTAGTVRRLGSPPAARQDWQFKRDFLGVARD